MDAAQAKLAFQVHLRALRLPPLHLHTTNARQGLDKGVPGRAHAQVIAERLTERAEHFVLEKGFRNAPP